MKTQTILSVSLALMLNSFILSGMAAGKMNRNEVNETEKITYYDFQVAPEEELNVENWMTNDSVWKNESENKVEKEGTVNSDEPLVIESWMTDDNLWQL